MKDSIPTVPKSKKVNTGIYETFHPEFGVVTVMKNEGTGMWQTIDSDGEWMQSYWFKSDALNHLAEN